MLIVGSDLILPETATITTIITTMIRKQAIPTLLDQRIDLSVSSDSRHSTTIPFGM